MNKKIIFFKSLAPEFPPTEVIAKEVLNNPKYDNNPYINKNEIEEAFRLYGNELNPNNSKIHTNIANLDINIEGHFLAINLPEVESIVVDDICLKNILYKNLDKHSDITHIGLSTYANGMDNTLEIIKIIQSEFKDKFLYIGGVGAVYPHIQKLVEAKNICKGDGVNWLREKFELKPYSKEDYKIPKVFSGVYGFPIPIKAAYMITQIGCPNNCDFCITNNFLKYNPFSSKEKIINYIEELCSESNRDIFLYICDPNALFPETIWKNVFNYFIENPKRIDNNVFMFFPGSLNHLNTFDLEKIQTKSPMKITFVNYGIESTLNGGYIKNKGEPKKVIDRLNKLGILTFHTLIIGLPFHTKESIDIDIQNNLMLNSDLVSVNTFKPIPETPIYNKLKSENRIYDEKLPPEFLYIEGFFPFIHEYLGGGFSILKYAFKAYYDCEKRVIDVHGNFANKLIDLFAITNSRKIKQAADVFMKMSQFNLPSFESRMSADLVSIYKNRVQNMMQKYKSLK